jgi:hypothetical protein
MPKCIWSNGTLVCNSSTYYRVDCGGRHDFPKLSSKLRKLDAERKRQFRKVRAAVRALAPGDQGKLAADLVTIVFAATWNSKKSSNAEDIKEVVQLALADAVPALNKHFIAWSEP